MFVTEDYLLGFIHIPRTGGTSVTFSFAASPIGIKQVCRTHAHYREYTSTQPKQWFATVRHPAARLHSGYYYQIEQDRKRLSGTLPMKSDLTIEFLQSRVNLFQLYGYEKTITSREFDKEYKKLKQQHNITSLNVLEQMQSVCKYIKGCDNILLFDIETQSRELFSWLKKFNSYVDDVHVNKKIYNSNWQDQLSDKLIQYIKDNYHDDLTRFDYQL